MPAARSWRGWIFWPIRSSQESLVGLSDPLTVVDVRGDEVCDLYAADLALMRPD